MPKICYVEKRFNDEKLRLISLINALIDQYTAQGYSLTLRQVYYQLVARAIIPNNERSYKNTGELINDARLAGLIDWKAIEDRTRNLRANPAWSSPSSILSVCADQYNKFKWDTQSMYIEVWVEKDALVDVVGTACNKYDVPYFSCRGYTSQTEMWGAAQRMARKIDDFNKDVLVLHLGDHDPSGIDMSRDIQERLELFGVDPAHFIFERIALNYDQIEQYSPPPNPAKLTDTRAAAYINSFGGESWELDALEPSVLSSLIERYIRDNLDDDPWEDKLKEQAEEKRTLKAMSNNYGCIKTYLQEELGEI